MRPLAGLVCVALLMSQALACGDRRQEVPDDVTLIAALPDGLLARGALWMPGQQAGSRLAALLDLEPGSVGATVTTAAPAVTVMSHAAAPDLAPVLSDRGFRELLDQPGEWRVLERVERSEAAVGIPAVGLGRGLIVAGSLEEVGQVIDHVGGDLADVSTPVPVDLLAGASVALVGVAGTGQGIDPTSPPAAGDRTPLRAAQAFVISGTSERAGVIALVVDDASQADAVALLTRVSTALVGDAVAMTSLVRPGAPLAAGDRVVLPLDWLADPARTLLAGLDQHLLSLLAPAP